LSFSKNIQKICDNDFIYAKYIFLFINIFFTFNIHLNLFNEFRVNIKSKEQKIFYKKNVK